VSVSHAALQKPLTPHGALLQATRLRLYGALHKVQVVSLLGLSLLGLGKHKRLAPGRRARVAEMASGACLHTVLSQGCAAAGQGTGWQTSLLLAEHCIVQLLPALFGNSP